MALHNPKYSFIQFNPADPDSCCNGIDSVCLPVVFGTDLKFQVISDSAPAALQVVRMNGDVISSNTGWADNGDGSYNWVNAINLTGLACDECFQLKIGSALSNCFIKKCDDCFTSILEYFNDEDYAEFIYCNTDFVNRVRLPLFLSKPKMTEDRGVYRKSNGAIKLTKSLLTKEYQVQTDFMTEIMHDALSVALAHDSINVYSSAYNGAISKSSEYNLPWDDDMCVAQADFKVAVTPFAVRNNNCQECADPPPPCVGVSVPSFSLPDANVDVAYNQTVTLSGTSPFSISSIVKPSWMTVTLSGSTVSFSGTPTEIGDSTPVTFTVANECGSVDVSKTIVVVVSDCVPVAITGSPSLPNGYVGDSYSTTFSITGDGPFSVGTVTKPAWMTVSINEGTKEVTLSGTPTDELTSEEVSIQITNCGAANQVVFSGSLTIYRAGVHFIPTTIISGDALTEYERANLVGGVPGATVTLKCDNYINSNGGTITMDGSSFVLGATFDVIMDGSGNGNIRCDIDGVTNPGTAILAHFYILSVSSGTISEPAIYQNSKSF